MSQRDVAWYENEDLKGLFIKAASNAMRGYHCAVVSPRTTFIGTNALIDFVNHLTAFLAEDERRVLIVVDKDLRKFGEQTAEMLNGKQIDSRIFDNVLSDVPRHTVAEACEICKEYEPRAIIAIGGGSAIDTAKLIMLYYEAPVININNMIAPSYVGLRKKLRTFAAIPTTSGTGAEATFIAVITDTDREPPKKTEVVLYEFCPDVAVLYPEFVKTMPPYLTMGTGMDAMAHAMGTYMLTMSTEFTDIHNLKGIEMVLKYLPRAVKRGNDMEAREKMQMAAYIIGIGFGNVSGGIEHGMGHSFGTLFHVHHGICVALYLCASVAYQSKVTNRFIDMAKVFGIKRKGKEKDEILRELLIKLQEFMKTIGCPLSISELDRPVIPRDEYMARMDQLVEFAFNDYVTLSSTRKVDPPQYRMLMEMAYENKIDDLMDLYYK